MISSPTELLDTSIYIDLEPIFGVRIHVKCEGFNFAGSIKLRPAAWMVEQAVRRGVIRSGSHVIESSSGNFGVALAVVAAARRLRFTCVTDPHCSTANATLIRAMRGEVVFVETADEHGSYLKARKDYVRRRCESDPTLIWLNQYENAGNWQAHRELTAPPILRDYPDLRVLFVGVGTGGTYVGCTEYFRAHRPDVCVVAVDTEGSVNFGRPGARHIPGIGASLPMPLLQGRVVEDVVLVPEREAIDVCRQLAARGMTLGGSSGTVIAGALRWLQQEGGLPGPSPAVAIAADNGERYVESVYDDEWCKERYGLPTRSSTVTA